MATKVIKLAATVDKAATSANFKRDMADVIESVGSDCKIKIDGFEITSAIKELKSQLKSAFGDIDFSKSFGIQNSLIKAIKDDLASVKDGLMQIVASLPKAGSALDNMGKEGSNGIDNLIDKLKELNDLVVQINDKNFGVTNVFNVKRNASTNTAAAELELYRKEATEVLALVTKLRDTVGTRDVLGGVRKALNGDEFANLYEKFQFDDTSFVGKIAGADTIKEINKIIAALNLYRDTFESTLKAVKKQGVHVSIPKDTKVKAAINDINEYNKQIQAADDALVAAANNSVKAASESVPDLSPSLNEFKGDIQVLCNDIKSIFDELKNSIIESMAGIKDGIIAAFNADNIKGALASLYTNINELMMNAGMATRTEVGAAVKSSGGSSGNLAGANTSNFDSGIIRDATKAYNEELAIINKIEKAKTDLYKATDSSEKEYINYQIDRYQEQLEIQREIIKEIRNRINDEQTLNKVNEIGTGIARKTQNIVAEQATKKVVADNERNAKAEAEARIAAAKKEKEAAAALAKSEREAENARAKADRDAAKQTSNAYIELAKRKNELAQAQAELDRLQDGDPQIEATKKRIDLLEDEINKKQEVINKNDQLIKSEESIQKVANAIDKSESMSAFGDSERNRKAAKEEARASAEVEKAAIKELNVEYNNQLRIISELNKLKADSLKSTGNEIDGANAERIASLTSELSESEERSVAIFSKLNNELSKTVVSEESSLKAEEARINFVSRRTELESKYNAQTKEALDHQKNLVQQAIQLRDAISGFKTNNTTAYNNNKTTIDDMLGKLDVGIGNGKINEDELKSISAQFKGIETGFKRAGESGKGFFNVLDAGYKKLGELMTVTRFARAVVDMFKKMVNAVKDVDAAMVELKKVTDLTESGYQKFFKTATSAAREVGAAVSDMINATADFARLGYNVVDATELAKAALIYKNVGDGIDDVSQASESMISTMKAFGIEADDAMHVVDAFNEVGKQYCPVAQ